MSFNETPLDFNLYSEYSIPHQYKAVVKVYTDITQSRADEIETEISLKMKIFHVDLSHGLKGLFNLKIICAQSSFTF